MPYEIEKRGSRYCVVKVSTGEVIPGGCHATARQAGAHKTAVEHSEGIVKQDSRENDPEYYAIVPDRELRSTWKLPMLNFEQISAAIQALSPAGFRGQRVEIPRGVSRQSVINKIQRRIASIQASDDAKDQLRTRLTEIKSITIVKGEDGLRRMFLITSNAYEDRERETITTKALVDYVESQWEDDTWKGDNFLLLGHRGAPIGLITFAEMIGPFLVEVGEELNTAYAHKRWDYIEAHPELEWGASHGFDFEENTKIDGIYHHIEKFETTVLPLARAANALTLAGVIA
jgi:hypothetical protein